MSDAVDPADLARARSEAAVLAAQIGVKQLQIERKQLVKRVVIENKVAGFYGRIRDTILTVPDRHAAILAAEYGLDSHALNIALVAILRQWLIDFADGTD
jgi:hypothetical protein